MYLGHLLGHGYANNIVAVFGGSRRAKAAACDSQVLTRIKAGQFRQHHVFKLEERTDPLLSSAEVHTELRSQCFGCADGSASSGISFSATTTTQGVLDKHLCLCLLCAFSSCSKLFFVQGFLPAKKKKKAKALQV